MAKDPATDDVDFGDPAPESHALPGPDAWDLDQVDSSFKEAFGLPDRLPAIRLPAIRELAALARRSPLLATACRLAEWTGPGPGPGHAVDADGELTAADTLAAVAELGLTAIPAVASMRDVPELIHLRNLALGTRFLEADNDETRFATGAAVRLWREGTDAEVLEIWSDALMFMVTDSLDIDADLDLRRGRNLDFYGTAMGLIALLFLARREGLRVAEVNTMIREAATSELPAVQAGKTWTSWTRTHGEPGDVLLHRLAQLGAVTVDGGDNEIVRLTPLGSWTVREQLAEAGVEIPLLPPPAEMTAADLVAAAEGADSDEIAAEADAWLAQRAPDAAARELLDFAAKGDPVERMVAISAAQRIGAAAVPSWRDALEVRAVRPYAKIALTEIAVGAPGVATLPGTRPEADDVAWLVTDLLAAAAEALEPEDLSIQLGQAVPRGTEEMMFGVMSRLPHPHAARVLAMIGQHHPDKKVAKAARRAAHQASGRLNSVP